MDIEVRVDINTLGHIGRTESEALWLYAASEWHRLYRDYVPFREGVLYSTVNFSAEGAGAVIEHTVPYAHYIYEGRVMGPNVPITQYGEVVGFFSPVKPKHYTGQMMRFSGMGTRHWDEAAMPTKGPLLAQSIQAFIDSGRLNFSGG